MMPAFATSIGAPSCRCRSRGATVCETSRPRLTMAAKGFGKKDDASLPRVPSEASKARDAAGERLDRMRESNAPEYSIWLRIIDVGEDAEEKDSPEFPWLPVGSMCIPRTGSVPRAIFNPDVYADLMSGARKMFPQLKRYEDSDVEIGYMPKDAPDEDDMSAIIVAKPEKESWVSKLQSGVGSLFKK